MVSLLGCSRDMDEVLVKPIETAEGLVPLLEAIRAAGEVCLDTEADSLHRYREKVCLLQFTLPGESGVAANFLVDPLAGLDLAPLFAALADKPLLLHGADYDLRMLKGDFGFTPRSIFDTMLAARLTGQKGLGLDALVQRYAGKQLDHGAQKADWSQRPLPPRLLRYAVEDTAHLPLIVSHLREELGGLGRLEWHRQQCAQLIETCSVVRERNPDEVWRIRGSNPMDRRRLAILRELWLWRDVQAAEWDRPTYMVCTNDKLIELVEWAVAHPQGDLRQGPHLSKRWPPRRWHALREALGRAWALPEEQWPQAAPKGIRPRFDPQFAPRMTRLRAARDAIAKALNLDASILAPVAQIEAIAGLRPRAPEELAKVERWLPWQTTVLGTALIEALEKPAERPEGGGNVQGPTSNVQRRTEEEKNHGGPAETEPGKNRCSESESAADG